MPIKIKCPSCQKVLVVKEGMAGKRAACPACKHVLTVPATSAAPAPASAAARPAPAVANPPRAAPPRPAQSKPPASPPPSADVENLAASLLADEPKPEDAGPAETIDLTCPMCDEPVKMSIALAGKQAPCPLCKRVIKVPVPQDPSKRNWRQQDAKPMAARRDTEPAPEGAWGSTTEKSIVSREALEEAEALPAYQRGPLTVRQWITRGVIAATLLVVIIGGTLFAMSWFANRKINKLADDATSYAADKRTPDAAVIHLGATRYHLRRNERDCIRDDKKDRGAVNQINLARGKLSGQSSAECDALLGELALLQLDLAGSKKEVEDHQRISWDDAVQEAVRTTQAITTGARNEAVRLVTRKLHRLNQTELVADYVRQIGDGPQSLAVAAFELHGVGSTGTGKTLFEEALKAYPLDAAAKDAVVPPLSMEMIGLAMLYQQREKVEAILARALSAEKVVEAKQKERHDQAAQRLGPDEKALEEVQKKIDEHRKEIAAAKKESNDPGTPKAKLPKLAADIVKREEGIKTLEAQAADLRPGLTVHRKERAEASEQLERVKRKIQELELLQSRLLPLGKALASALNEESGQARQLAGEIKETPLRLEVLVCCAELASGSAEGLAAVQEMLQLVSALKPQELGRLSPWLFARLVRIGLDSGMGPDALAEVGHRLAEDDSLRGWIEYRLFRAKLEVASDKVTEGLLDTVERRWLCHGLARIDWAEHNTRQDKSTVDAVNEWDEGWRPHGKLGAALGLQKR